MVIDSSAVVAILFQEPEAEWFEAAILSDSMRYMSAASLVETSIVLDRHFGENASDESWMASFSARVSKLIPYLRS